MAIAPLMTTHGKALILFSGGQDSATCLAWALARYDYVETVGFEYGQRHSIEMQCRQDVLSAFKRSFLTGATKLAKTILLIYLPLARLVKPH